MLYIICTYAQVYTYYLFWNSVIDPIFGFPFAPLHITNIVLIVDIGSYFYILYRDSCGMRHPANSILSGIYGIL
jgi:hypothetical protein